MSATVYDLLEQKGHEVVTIDTEAPVIEAVKLMAERSIGSLLAMTKKGEIAGIIAERDVFRKVILAEKSVRETLVRDVMASQVVFVTDDTTADECLSLMTEKRIRHLPVFRGKELVGIVSIGDAVKHLVSEKDLMIRNLTKYIDGSL